MKVLLVDNYDSFTYNLVHYLQISGADVSVVRNNELNHINTQNFDTVVLSPGPCTPTEAGSMMPFLYEIGGVKPVLGVCLGMQAIGLYHQWNLVQAHEPRHGKTSLIMHDHSELFDGIPSPMQVGRYHSLIIQPGGENTELIINASCENEIMVVSNSSKKMTGVQFHPESIMTPFGQKLIQNWINIAKKQL